MAATLSVTQDTRPMRLITPLGKDVLLFQRMQASDRLGRLFDYRLELLSLDHDLQFAQLLGQNVSVELERLDGETRWFNGFVSRFAYVGTRGRFAMYKASLRPWLWFLTRNADCR